MKIKKLLFLMFALALSANTVMAQETVPFVNAPSQASSGLVTYNMPVTGGYTLGTIDWDGIVTVLATGTYGSELKCDISGPLGSTSLTLGFGSTFPSGINFTGNTASFDNAGDPVGTWTFDFYESFDDGSDGLPDANWDNIDFTFNPSTYCPTPSGLIVSGQTATAADLSWTAASGATGYNWEVVPTGNGQGNGVVDFGSTAGLTATAIGLSALTSYDAYVQNDCGSAYAGPVSFMTACGTYSTPFTQDFNSTYVPTCWYEAYGDVPTPAAASSAWGQSTYFANATGNSKGVKMNVYSTDNDWLISPDIELGAGNKQISYHVAATTYNGTGSVTMAAEDNVYVLIKSAAGNWDLANALAVYTSGNTPSNIGTDLSIELTGWTGIVNFAFYTKGAGTTPDIDIHFDNFIVEEIPACPAPTGLIVSGQTATTADLSWTAASGATGYNWEVVPAGNGQGVGVVDFGSTASLTATATGLSALTSYDAYVQNDCGSTYAAPFTFMTECGIYSTPFTQDFNGSYVPTCWYEAYGDVPTPAAASSAWGQSAYFANASGNSKGIRMNVYSTDNDWLISPDIDLGAGNKQIRYYVAATTKNGIGSVTMAAEDKVYVLIKNSSGTWDLANALAVYTSGDTPSNTGIDVAIELSGWTGIVNFAFYTKGSGNIPDMDIHFDNFIVEDIPACPAPSGFSVSVQTTTTADLSWIAPSGATGYNWEVVPAGNGQGNGVVDFGSTTGLTATVTGLSEATSYDAYVQNNCGSTYNGPITFYTPSGVPFFDGFEVGNTDQTVIAGWTQESVSGSYNWMANSSLTSFNRTPRTGLFNAYMQFGNTRWMFKAIELTGGHTYIFSMFARQDISNPSQASIKVSYGTSATAAAMINPIAPVLGITNGDYQEVAGSCTPATTGIYYLGIWSTITAYPYYISIDDISLTEASLATLSWYNYQWPDFATIDVTQNATATAQCWESGVTEAAGPGTGIECWIGYNSSDTDPSTWTNWVATTYNYGADPSNNDEYQADLGFAQGLAPGTYYLASRFRYQFGPYTYGGFQGGAWDGTTNVSGVLTINPIANDYCSGAISLICGDAVAGTTTLATYDNAGTCGYANTYPGVWYKFTGIGDMVSVDLCTGTSWDSKISVFEGTCGSLVCVDGNDDYCNFQSRMDWFAETGVDYYILVHQYSTTGGAFTLTVNCTYPTTATWQGDDSSPSAVDWFGADNWDVADVPGLSTDVIIPTGLSYYPTVDRKGACNNISVASGARLVDRGTGYLIPGGTATVDRDYTGGEWHLISAPISNATAVMFTGLYLQNHTESTNAYTDISNPAALLNVMQGYALWNDAAGTASFVGTLNTGNYGSGLTRTGLGWNLVGNPYPSPIDWNAATGWTKTNVDNATYRHVNNATWAEYVGGVGANGGTRYIAGEQGFFVGVTSGETAGTLNMTNAVRTHSTSTFYKDEVADIVRLEINGNGYTNETVIRFLDIATPEFDGQWDAHKLFGIVPGAPAIYSSHNGMMAINSLPFTNVVPLGVKAGIAGTFTIEATETSEFSDVLIEDLLTGRITDLKSNSYSFYYDLAMDNRFILHFAPLGVDDNFVDYTNIYSYGKDVYVNVSEITSGDIVIYNLMGQKVISTSISGLLNKVTLKEGGYYVVVVRNDETVVTEKVFIK